MKLYWLNGGLRVEPQNDAERAALGVVADSLQAVDVNQGVKTGPIGVVDAGHEQPVVSVDKLLQVVAHRGGSDTISPSDGPLREQVADSANSL
jgi:hypothetical protein